MRLGPGECASLQATWRTRGGPGGSAISVQRPLCSRLRRGIPYRVADELGVTCTLCGSQENPQRKQLGAMLKEWEKKFPGRLDNMLHALQNVVRSHVADGTLYD